MNAYQTRKKDFLSSKAAIVQPPKEIFQKIKHRRRTAKLLLFSLCNPLSQRSSYDLWLHN